MKEVWRFETAKLAVILEIEQEYNYRYDGDDDDGSTQAALDSGELIAFDSCVRVVADGVLIGADYLGSSVYRADSVREFWTAHRDNDPANRNCSIMREIRGRNAAICHYFPGMVSGAIAQARAWMTDTPRIRKQGSK